MSTVAMVYEHEQGFIEIIVVRFMNDSIFRMYKNANHHGCDQRLSESEMCYERSGENCDDEHQQVAP